VIAPLGEAFRVWLRVAALSFGGPAGQIAVMHRILVEEKRWVSDARFLHALNYCMLLPGPEALQLAAYIGWLMNGALGGVMAGGLFILPGVASIMALSWIYALYGHVGLVAGLFFGLKAAVLAIVVEALIRVGRRALRNGVLRGFAAAGFVALFFFAAPFPLVIVVAGAIGYIGARAGLVAFAQAAPADSDSLLGEATPAHARASWRRLGAAVAVWLPLWLAPVAILLATLGADDVFSRIAVFFSEMALVSFGGAYAVLAYVAQQAVQHYGWLSAHEMLDGLGMAETTPGPLVTVLQFVGFLAAFHKGGLLAGTLGGLLASWVTFVPCFLWIFAGAPFIESLRDNRALRGALLAITAVVVGVILDLAVWFAIHTLFGAVVRIRAFGLAFDAPAPASVDPYALLLALGAAFALFRLKASAPATLAACAAAGALLRGLGLIAG
jgi:chromate transporter